jgi:hypothetical protein
MKLKSLVAAAIVLASANAHANLSERDMKLQARYTDRVLKCARKAVDQKRGGLFSIELASKYLTKAQEIKGDVKGLKALYKACNDERLDLDRQKDVTWGELQAEVENTVTDNKAVQSILKTFTHPYVKCNLAGANVNVGVGIAIGVGMKVASCKATNGKRFFGIAPETEFGIGGGFHALVGSNTFGYYLHDVYYRDNNVQRFNSNVMITAGIGPAGAGEFEGDDEGFGLGIGLMFTGRTGINFKIIPRTNDFDALRAALLK